MAPPTTNSPTIIITTELEKPVKASSGVSMPMTISATSAHNATISERTLPFMKKHTDNNSTTIVSTIYFLNYFSSLANLAFYGPISK
jgi:hypothetical protein